MGMYDIYTYLTNNHAIVFMYETREAWDKSFITILPTAPFCHTYL